MTNYRVGLERVRQTAPGLGDDEARRELAARHALLERPGVEELREEAGEERVARSRRVEHLVGGDALGLELPRLRLRRHHRSVRSSSHQREPLAEPRPVPAGGTCPRGKTLVRRPPRFEPIDRRRTSVVGHAEPGADR